MAFAWGNLTSSDRPNAWIAVIYVLKGGTLPDDNLAHWLSEYPHLINKIEQHPNIERYLRRTPLKITTQRVDDDTWNKITLQLAQ